MTDKKTEALKLALEALEYISSHYMSLPKIGCMALAAVEEALAEQTAQQECWCTTCRPITVTDMRFVVCPECGNKRCPKANDHRNTCTGSNDVGQKGSSWEHVKPAGEQPAPPPECQTDAEKKAFAFGWWKALEKNRKQPASATELREQQEPVSWERFMSVEKELQDMTAEFMRVAKELAALKTQQQEPYCYHDGRNIVGKEYADHSDVFPLYTSTPASKPWVSLTDEEIQKEFHPLHATGLQFARSIEAKLREKNQ